MEKEQKLRTWVEVNLSSLRKNFKALKDSAKAARFMAVVKSNAYGHGMIPFSKELDRLGADWFGVDDLDEALALRQAGIKKPILVLGYTLPERFTEAAGKGISVTVSNFNSLKRALEFFSTKNPRMLKIHIKVDTGLNRQGFVSRDLEKVLHELSAVSSAGGSHQSKKNIYPNLQIEGFYTHFAAAESLPKYGKRNYTYKQIENFNIWIESFRKLGLDPITHSAATAATLACPESHFDMVRVGIGLYGLWPSPQIRKVAEKKVKLYPVLSWKSIVADEKDVLAGSPIGYDCTEMVKENSTIAIVPIGYWHGYPRHLSGIGEVLIKGKRAKVLGRISMDMLTVDVSAIKGVKTGDEVIIIGKQGKEEIFAEELAEKADTINYEIVTRINPGIERMYFRP